MTLIDFVEKPKFFSLSELKQYHNTFIKLGDRDTFYCSNGIFLGFSRKRYIIEKSNREEFGEPGVYIISVSAFTQPEYAKTFFRLSDSEIGEMSGWTEKIQFIPNVVFGMKFKEAQKVFSSLNRPDVFHQEGESRGLNESKEFVFQYDYIKYDNISYYFFGHPKKGTLQGFTCFLK
jgi:hypothetical protein